ncbi:MAG: SCO6745 family protein [Acidimicrobiales bacterium]
MLDDLARRIAKPAGDLPSNFMLDSATYEHGNSLGFDGLDFYICGRAGVLGAVTHGVVSASLVFFNPGMVRERWERGMQVIGPREAAMQFAGCLHRWSAQHLAEDPDYETLAGLLGQVISQASPAGAPLFAGWMSLPEPTEPAELVMHRLNALRELRGALHGAAVLASGLDPLVALLIKTPFLAAVFGWEEPYPDVELAKEAWTQAEAATNRAMGRMLKVLAGEDQEALAELLEQVHSGIH